MADTIISQAVLASSDAALVKRARAGDLPAFETLIAPRFDRLLRLSYSIVAHDADASDAVQESCLRAWRELPNLRDPERFEAWLWQIAINACRSALRTRRRAAIREIAVESMPAGSELVGSARPLGDDLSDTDVV